MSTNKTKGILVILMILLPLMLMANNLVLENISITDINTSTDVANIEFDISWDNSFCANGGGTMFSAGNWDAAWVFAKYSVDGGAWNHCTLATTGHTAPTGSTIENPPTTSDNRQAGVMIHRNAQGFGSNDWDNAKIVWDYGTDGVADDASVSIRLFGIEMCFIPGGDFYLGDGDSNGTFRQTGSNTPVQITSGETTVKMDGTNANSGDATLQSGIKVDGDDGICTTGTGAIDNANYPTGYKSFYTMKYEITQGQWVDFLNTLTSSQATSRYYETTDYRYTITGTHPNYTASRPDRNCNYLSVMDGMAYADWAGLRPMTELEFEKACRGTQSAISGEYAWGTATICTNASLTISGTENGTETITTDVSAGACLYSDNTHSGGDGGNGPLRAGIFAETATDRKGSGASYYGLMEMSGSLYERPVTLGNSTGRAFAGTHGNGILTSDGFADKTNWPGYAENSDSKNSGATGSGFRGGSWDSYASEERVSDRDYAAITYTGRTCSFGFRASRTW